MKVHTDLARFRGVRRPVLTTGTFDGVHRGHREILARLTALAQAEAGESALFTFHPHPRLVLNPGDDGLRLLSTPDEKQELLRATGLDHLLVVPFSRRFSGMSAEAYVKEVLVDAIGVHAVVIGYDHRFGRDRSGGIGLLRDMGDRHGFQVHEIPPHEVEHVTVSSTKVRQALTLGDVRGANELLGYRYGLSGMVVKGDQLGRTLGFPTANVGAIDPLKLIPADGVYAVEVELRDGHHGGMLYIGPRPTVHGAGHRVVEVNIFGLDRDLYGEAITVRCVERLRGDLHFNSMEELRQQLHHDRQHALERLGTRTWTAPAP
jgi:riboflavin kinase/FMN adenylyltransferase